jgi:hypothetical protein
MSFGAEARARLFVLPVCALVVPWRCSLGPPLAGRGETAPPPATQQREPPAISVASGKRELSAVSAATEQREVSAVSAASEKREPPAQRVSSASPHPPPVPIVTLPEEIVLDASTMTPFVTWGTNPEQTAPITGIAPMMTRDHLKMAREKKWVADIKDDAPPLAVAILEKNTDKPLIILFGGLLLTKFFPRVLKEDISRKMLIIKLTKHG